MHKRKYIYFSIVIIILGCIGMYNYMYKNHRDIAAEKPNFNMDSKTFGKEFLADIDEATAKYIDKIIQVSGTITEVESDNFTLDDQIVCYTDSLTIKNVKMNNTILVKGRSIGYDELLEFIKLDQVTIINY